MSSNKKNNGFIVQAGILAAAGIITRIIGMLYRSPLQAIIGDEGNGYYSTAYNIYRIILLVSSYSIPSAMSKVIAGKLAAKEYRNAHKIFKGALFYVLLIGGAASLIVFFAAPVLVTQNSIVVLRVLAPTIFLYGMLGVLRGYFQAHKSMVQTSVSQIMEQILNAAVSMGAAYLLIQMVAGQDDTTKAIYGAAGSALGTGVGVVAALLFMVGIYALNSKTFKSRIKRDHTRHEISYQEIFKLILTVVTPFILSTCIYNLSDPLNQTLYLKIAMNVHGVAEKELATNYGILAKSIVVANIPIAMASAMASAIMPGIAADLSLGKRKETKLRIASAIRTTMFISIPAAIGIGVLAKPVIMFLYPQKESIELATFLLQALAITIVFYALSTLSNGILQGLGLLQKPIMNALIALAIQTVVIIPLLLYTNLGLYAIIIATVIYSFCVCLLNALSVRKHLGYKQEIVKTFIKPTLSAAVMGVIAWLVYMGVYALCHINIVSLLVAVGIGVCAYFVIVICSKTLDEKEMRELPKGAMLVRIAKKVRLIR